MKLSLMTISFAVISLCTVAMGKDTYLRVGVHPSPPCVVYDDGSQHPSKLSAFSGHDIMLFKEIAKELNEDWEPILINDFKQLFTLIDAGSLDVACAAISITSEREKHYDFSHPYMPTGIGILTKADCNPSFIKTLGLFFSSSWDVAAIFLGFIFVCGIIIWLAEQGSDSFADNWKGMFDGFWWTNVTMTTVGYGDKVPKKAIGKFLAVVVIWVGIYVISPYVVAKMSYVMSSDRAKAVVTELTDLKEYTIIVKRGTTSEDLVNTRLDKSYNVQPISGKIDADWNWDQKLAIVADIPILKSMQAKNQDLSVVGPIKKESYGFLFKQGSPLRDRFNQVLIKMEETGRLDNLRSIWGL